MRLFLRGKIKTSWIYKQYRRSRYYWDLEYRSFFFLFIWGVFFVLYLNLLFFPSAEIYRLTEEDMLQDYIESHPVYPKYSGLQVYPISDDALITGDLGFKPVEDSIFDVGQPGRPFYLFAIFLMIDRFLRCLIKHIDNFVDDLPMDQSRVDGVIDRFYFPEYQYAFLELEEWMRSNHTLINKNCKKLVLRNDTKGVLRIVSAPHDLVVSADDSSKLKILTAVYPNELSTSKPVENVNESTNANVDDVLKSSIGWWVVTPDLVPEPFWIAAMEHNGRDDMDIIVINNMVSLFIWLLIFYSLHSIYNKRFDQGWVLAQSATTHSTFCKTYYNHFMWYFDFLYLCFAEDDIWFAQVSSFSWGMYTYYIQFLSDMHQELYHDLEDIFISHEIVYKEFGTVYVRNIRVRNMMIRSDILVTAFNLYFCVIMQCALLNVELWEGEVEVPEDGGLWGIEREPIRLWPVTVPREEYPIHCYDSVFFTNYIFPNDHQYLYYELDYETHTWQTLYTPRRYKGINIMMENTAGMNLYEGSDIAFAGYPHLYWTPGALDNAWIYRFHPAFLLDWVEPGYFFKEFSFIY